MLLIYLAVFCCLSPFISYFRTIVRSTEFILFSTGFCLLLFLLLIPAIRKQKTIEVSSIDIGVIFYIVFLGLYFTAKYFSSLPLDPVLFFSSLYLAVFYFIFRYTLTIRNFRTILAIVVLAGIFQSGYGLIYQKTLFSSHIQLIATFSDSPLFAAFLMIGTISVLSAILFYSKIKQKHLFVNMIVFLCLIGLLLLFLYTIALTKSRAVFLALGLSVFILFYVKLKETKRFILSQKHKYSIALLFLIALLPIVYFLYSIRPESADGRLFIWQIASEMIKERPVFGFGTDGFRQNYMFYQADFFRNNPDSPFTNLADNIRLTFNEIIKTGVEQGIAGLLVLFLLCYLILMAKTRRKNQQYLLSILKTLLFSLFIFGLFSYPSDSFRLTFVVVLFIALLSSLSSGSTRIKIEIKHFLVKNTLMAVSFCFLICLGISSIRFIDACKELTKITRTKSADYSGKTVELERLYPQLNATTEFLSYYISVLGKEEQYDEALIICKRLEDCYPNSRQQIMKGEIYYSLHFYGEAHQAWILASEMVPVLVKPHYLLAKSYYREREFEKAQVHARCIVDSRPKVYTPEVYYMRKEMAEMINLIIGLEQK